MHIFISTKSVQPEQHRLTYADKLRQKFVTCIDKFIFCVIILIMRKIIILKKTGLLYG